MSKKNKIVNKIMPIIAIVIISASFASSVFAYDGGNKNNTQNENKIISTQFHNKQNRKNKKTNTTRENRRNKKIEQYKEIQTAIDNKDYNAWKIAISQKDTKKNKELLAVINETNFKRYTEAKILAQNGDRTEFNKLKIELGLNDNRK